MLSFESDYTVGAHPGILEKLVETNNERLSSYGADIYSESAKAKIREACGCPSAGVFFLSGGTQTNAVVLSALLRKWEGVVCADTGHINAHEAGAIEYTGHKVIGIPHDCGRINADSLEEYLRTFYADGNREHMVFPGVVYISHPTEYGTLYTKKQLERLRRLCDSYGMRLYMDGARLGYGLASFDTDVTLPDIASLCDAFYIGGTKVGALCGEAVVFPHNNTPEHFMNTVKRHGAMLAKGRLTGIQFDVLFTDSLYFRISRKAIETAEMLKTAFRTAGYEFFIDSPTNQQFIIMTDEQLSALDGKTSYSVWEKLPDGRTAVRFATSWATEKEDIEALRNLI